MARTRTRRSDVSNEPSHATSLLVVAEQEQKGGIGTNMVSAEWGRPTQWSPRATWGGSAPVDELLSTPTGPISYRRMRCLEGPALGESTLRVFGVCVCPVAALRAPGAMLRLRVRATRLVALSGAFVVARRL